MSYNKHTVSSFSQQLKNYDANQSIESLLHDEEFASLLRGIFISLPSDFQSTAREMLTKTNQREKKKTKSPALSAIIEIHNIALPPTIQDHCWLWKENPSRFWHPVEISHANQSVEFIAVEAYLVVRRLRQRQIWENIKYLKGVEFGNAMFYLRSQGIMELSVQFEADVVANRILNAALDPFKWDVVDSRTFAANQSMEPKIVPVESYAESKVVGAGPSIVSQAVTAGPTSEPKALDTKPISITSLLNPPDAGH
ncbi:hypothetical protein BTUL_0002g01250 [Botrytis tulipae]|uniref:Uncharacterized protein n=1 Tax=Botrytis tulipae TaxID=87230 RepID=A0A4Z1F8L1_9HELO|nr:hypothetical protein BTUL_0002g01250 [Botrytis tulipae]